ncbi:MAG TPA: glycosyltransferase [Longimicrobiaceae bacterium]|nr:glycosyltransferase [Longimicrobiaceae bacterium]
MKLVIQNVSPVWGGNEKWLATLASGLVARGHEVVVACRREGPVAGELGRRGIRTAAMRAGGYADPVRAARFARWLRRERPDALLITSWKEMGWAAWAGRRAGARVVVRLGIVRAPRHRRHTLPFRCWVDALIVNASEIRRGWLDAAPWFPADAVHVILNGIRPHGATAADTVRALRESVSAGPETLLFGGAGHVARRKGFDLLLQAFERAAVPDARVVIVGSGPEEAPLRALAERIGIADRVSWLGHRDDVPDVLAACDVFVLGSRNEGMANVMLEAMAAGTPVVATDVSGVRAALGATRDDPPAGWIVPPDDVPALAAALGEVAADLCSGGREAQRRAGEASRRVREWFSVDRMVDEAERVLFARGS